MNLNIFQETNPVSGTNVLVGAIYKNSAPLTLIDHFTYPIQPYTGQTQAHTFSGILDVAYRYVCWESPDGTASGTIRNDFVVQPSSNAFQTKDDLYITSDLDPTIIGGGLTYGPDANLVGWNWDLERKDFPGTMKYTRDYVKTKAGVDTIQDDINADGWRITNGQTINNNEDFIHHFQPQLTSLSAPATASVITGVQILTGNTTLDEHAKGVSYVLSGASAFFQVNLPDVNTFADGDTVYFLSAGGIHVGVLLASINGLAIQAFKDSFLLGSNTKSGYIILSQNEAIGFYRYTNAGNALWGVLYTDGGYMRVGEQLSSYSLKEMNTVMLNGQALSRTNYRRLWDWVQTLDAALLITDTAWNTTTATLGTNAQVYFTQKGKFSTGDGSSTFRVPDLTAYGFQRFKSSIATVFEVGIIESHKHTMHAEGTIAGAGGPYYLSRSNGGGYSGGGANTFGGRPVGSGPDTTMKTGRDNADTTGTQYETRPNSFSTYPLIRI